MKLYISETSMNGVLVAYELLAVGAQYELINVDVDEEANQQLTDAGLSSPVLEVDGKLIRGYAINEEINLLGARLK